MRVALIADQLDAPETGIGRYVGDLVATLLACDGVDATFLTSSEGATNAERLGVEPARIHRTFSGGTARRALTASLSVRAAAHGADVVHATKHVVPLRGTRTVLTVHDDFALRPPPRPDLRWALRRRLFGVALDRADVLLATTEEVAASLCAARPALGDRVRVEGLRASGLARSISAEPVAALAALAGRPFGVVVGDLDPRKNVELVLGVWDDVHVRTGCVLALVGARHRGSVRPAGLDAAVTRGAVVDVGPVSDDQLRWCYRTARMTLLPSTAEGFGYPVAEAAAFGCPVITTPVPAVDAARDVPGSTVVVVPATDVDGWRTAATRLATAPERPPSPAPPSVTSTDGDRCRRLREAYEAAVRR